MTAPAGVLRRCYPIDPGGQLGRMSVILTLGFPRLLREQGQGRGTVMNAILKAAVTRSRRNKRHLLAAGILIFALLLFLSLITGIAFASGAGAGPA